MAFQAFLLAVLLSYRKVDNFQSLLQYKNTLKYFFELLAHEIKRWLLWFMNNGTTTLLTASIEVETLKKHLAFMLDEIEAQHETGTEFSPEALDQYIAAAEYMGKQGRPTGALEVIKQSIDF